MAKWHFWGEKEFSDIYENIYIRSMMEDWLGIVLQIVKEIDAVQKSGEVKIIDIGSGEGHTIKQILDRIKGQYICDLVEPNKNALATAEAMLAPENNIGNLYPLSLATFKPEKAYDVVFTSHTNYYWAFNEKDYNRQLGQYASLIAQNGVGMILTLPEESDHYQIALRQIYPPFNYAQYIIDFYQAKGFKVDVRKMTMRMYVGDILSTDKFFDLKVFYRFVHNTGSYPTNEESREFLEKIKKYQKNNYLDFKDYLILISK